MKLPKKPIDNSKAGSGDAPFDAKVYLSHFKNKDIISCPMPEFEEKKESE